MTQQEAERFVALWWESPTLTEFCERSGYDERRAANVACRLRREGIDVPRRPRGGGPLARWRLDLTRLARVASRCRERQGEARADALERAKVAAENHAAARAADKYRRKTA